MGNPLCMRITRAIPANKPVPVSYKTPLMLLCSRDRGTSLSGGGGGEGAGANIHIFVFTNLENNGFEMKLITQNTNI